MVQRSETVEVCSFCQLVLQIGYDELTPNDRRVMRAHLRLRHQLDPYYIQP